MATKSVTKPASSMEELLKAHPLVIHRPVVGQKIKAKVIEIARGRILFDIGGKSEGIIEGSALEEVSQFVHSLSAGDTVLVTVTSPETPNGYVLLSLRHTASDGAWREYEADMDDKKPVKVLVKSVSDAGLSVEAGGLFGFVPSSQLSKELLSDMKSLTGKNLLVRVIEANKAKNRLVFSERAVSEGEEIEEIEKLINDEKVKDKVYTGKITSVAGFGVFVAIDVESGKKEQAVEGLVHISELSWEKVDNPADKYKVGADLKVKILGIRDGKLALSAKSAQDDPWKSVATTFKKEDRFKGKVVRNSDFGMFVSIAPGIEGLVHITKIPPASKFVKGQEVDCYIEEIDLTNKKISLGLVLSAKPIGYK